LSRPRGPAECLENAVGRLGPFAQRQQVDAEKCGPWGGPRNRTPLSEELAREQILALTVGYNRRVVREQNAPRSKHVLNQLNKIKELADGLAGQLRSLDDQTRRVLQTAGSGVAGYLGHVTSEIIEATYVPGLPLPGSSPESENESDWIVILDGLSEFCSFATDNFLMAKGIEDVRHPDKGGNTNLYRESYGAASWFLVNEGWYVHELFKPNTSKGTEGGAFHVFLLDVFEYATGLDPEEHSKLMPWIKHVCRVNRQSADLIQRELSLIDEQIAIDSPESRLSLEERKKRHAEVEAKFLALRQEQFDLCPKLYPFGQVRKDPRQ
jgi:hypothetical protein